MGHERATLADRPDSVTKLQCNRCGVWVPINKLDMPTRCTDPVCPLNALDRARDVQVRRESQEKAS